MALLAPKDFAVAPLSFYTGHHIEANHNARILYCSACIKQSSLKLFSIARLLYVVMVSIANM